MSLGRGFAVFSLAGVVAAAVLCGTARPTHANCGAGTSLVVPDQSGALDITWRYDSTNDTLLSDNYISPATTTTSPHRSRAF